MKQRSSDEPTSNNSPNFSRGTEDSDSLLRSLDELSRRLDELGIFLISTHPTARLLLKPDGRPLTHPFRALLQTWLSSPLLTSPATLSGKASRLSLSVLFMTLSTLRFLRTKYASLRCLLSITWRTSR